MINNKGPAYMCDKIKYKNEHERKQTLRSRNHLERSKALEACTQNSLLFKGINMYNALPKDILNEENHNLFKTK